MRRILVESARRKRRLKHGGGRHAAGRSTSTGRPVRRPPTDLLALDEALTRLADDDPASGRLVKLRFFAGLTMAEQAAAVLGISLATADRHWAYARAWLHAELADAS